MLQNSSNSLPEGSLQSNSPLKYKWSRTITLSAWVLFGFISAQLLLVVVVQVLIALGVPIGGITGTVFNTVSAAVVYLFSLAIVIGLPWLIKKRRTTQKDLGLQRLPSWTDIFLAPAAFVIYTILSGTGISCKHIYNWI